MKKRILSLLLVVALLWVAGCTSDATQKDDSNVAVQQTEQAAEDALVDMAGEPIKVDSIEKAVSLTPAGTEIIYALGAEDALIGVDAFSNYPEQAQQLEIVGDFNGPDVEKIASLEPDVVLASNSLQLESVEKLRELGLHVVSIEATSFGEIAQSIELMGDLFGKQAEAEQINTSIHEAVAHAEKNAPEKPQTVYYAMSYGEMGNWTSGPGSFVNTMIETAGGECTTKDAAFEWVEYPMEDLVAADPDIILVASDSGSAEDFSETPSYSELSAVKNNAVYTIDADIFSRPGPRIAQALDKMSELLNI